MQRREFISLVGGAATWPLSARAQSSERMRRIGFLISSWAEDDPESKLRIAAFVEGLQQLDWTVGRNVQIEIRYGAGDPCAFGDPQPTWWQLRPTSLWALTVTAR